MFKLEREETFATRLTKALNHNDMQPYELANRMGVTQGTISQYRKDTVPSTDRVFDIANILQVNPVWLLGYNVSRDFEPFMRKPTQEELDLVQRYNDADNSTQNAICAILGIKKKNIPLESSKVG